MRCFNEVYERLLAGWGPSELARFIQEDRSEYADATRSGLMQLLQRFRDSVPPAQLLAHRMPKAFHKAEAAVEEGLDVVKELEELYLIQKERLNIDFAHEKSLNKLMAGTMVQEVRAASELLVKINQAKMDLGIATRHLGQVDVDAQLRVEIEGKYGKQSIKQVVEDPEKRRKVLNIAERIIALPARTEKAVTFGHTAPAGIDAVDEAPSDDEFALAAEAAEAPGVEGSS